MPGWNHHVTIANQPLVELRALQSFNAELASIRIGLDAPLLPLNHYGWASGFLPAQHAEKVRNNLGNPLVGFRSPSEYAQASSGRLLRTAKQAQQLLP
jgi:hypothetical protein